MGPISTLPSVTSWTLSGRVHPVAHWAPPLSQSQCLRGLLQADVPWPECRPPHTRAGPGGNRLRGLVAGPGGKVRAGRGAGKSRDRCCPLAGSNPLMLGGQREDPNVARQHQGPPGRASSPRRLSPTSVSPEWVLTASLLASCSPRPASGFDPGSFQITAPVLGLGAHEMLCALFKKRVSVSCRRRALLYAGHQRKPHQPSESV